MSAATDPDLRQSPPATRSERLLPLTKVHETDFEEICVEITEHEGGIARADLKRIKGVAQYGVDVEGFSREQDPVLVVSCKRYQSITPAKVKEWSDDFLNCWDSHWIGKGVQRFALAVTVELNDDGLNTQIKAEALRFKEKGLQYEIWGLKQLTSKLRPLPDVVGQYFHPAWIEIICGAALLRGSVLPGGQGYPILANAAVSVASSLASVPPLVTERFGKAVGAQLASVLAKLQEGVTTPLRSLIQEMRADSVSWELLPSDIKSRLLSAEAVLALRDGDIDRASALYQQSEAFHPPRDRRMAGLVAYLKDGPDAGLQLIEKAANSPEASLRAGLLIEAGRIEEALTLIDEWPGTEPDQDSFEPYRLKAMAYSIRREDKSAIEAIEVAEAAAQSNFSVRLSAGMIRFSAALSPKMSFQPGEFPNPISAMLFREDDEALACLDAAEKTFGQLVDVVDNDAQRQDIEVWRLACLIANRGRTADAAGFAELLLKRERPHPGAIVWAAHAGLKVDFDGLVKSISALVDRGAANVSEVVAAAYLLSSKGNGKRALKLLRKALLGLSDPAERSFIEQWISDLEPGSTDGEDDAFGRALSELEKSRNASSLTNLIDRETMDGTKLLTAFEALMAFQKWKEVNLRREVVLTVGTARVVEIAAVAAHQCGDHDGCLTVLQDHRTWFRLGVLPYRLRQLEAQASLAAGRADLAIRTLQELVDSGVADNDSIFNLVATRLQIGDVEGAIQMLRSGPLPKGLRTENALRIALEVVSRDPDLARDIVNDVDWEKVTQALLPAAFKIASALRMDEVLKSLGVKAKHSDSSAAGGVEIIESYERFATLMSELQARHERSFEDARQLWLRGSIPIHLMFDDEATVLLEFFRRPFSSPPTVDENGSNGALPFLVKSSTRAPGEVEVSPAAGRYETLVLDITALLLGHELDVLKALTSIADTILVPQAAIELIRSLEMQLRENSNVIRPGIALLEKAFADGAILQIDSDDEVDDELSFEGETALGTGKVNVASLLTTLTAERGLDPALLAALPAGQSNATIGIPDVPSRVRVNIGNAILLSDLGLLSPLMEHVTLSVSKADIERFRRDLDEVRRTVDDLAAIEALRKFVAERLEQGSWRFATHSEDEDAQNPTRLAASPGFRCLTAALRAGEKSGGALWVEDRMVSRYKSVGTARVLSVSDIIETLRAERALDVAAAEKLRQRLGTAGYALAMPSPRAIAEALAKAPIVDGYLVETAKLSEYRKWVSVQISTARHMANGLENGFAPDTAAVSDACLFFAKVIGLIWDDANVTDASARAVRVGMAKPPI